MNPCAFCKGGQKYGFCWFIVAHFLGRSNGQSRRKHLINFSHFRYNQFAAEKLPRIAPLAQLDRASGYEPEGREFESLRARHSFQVVAAEIPIAELGPLGPTV